MRKIVLMLGTALVLAACGGNKEANKNASANPLAEKIKGLEKNLDLVNANPAQMNTLIQLYQRYADSVPKDRMAPVCLMKAADLYRAQGLYARQCDLYKLVLERYPDFKDADMAQYLYASTLDSDLDQRPEAKKQYQVFVEKYPNSTYIDGAKARLATIDSLSFKQLIDMQGKTTVPAGEAADR